MFTELLCHLRQFCFSRMAPLSIFLQVQIRRKSLSPDKRIDWLNSLGHELYPCYIEHTPKMSRNGSGDSLPVNEFRVAQCSLLLLVTVILCFG